MKFQKKICGYKEIRITWPDSEKKENDEKLKVFEGPENQIFAVLRLMNPFLKLFAEPPEKQFIQSRFFDVLLRKCHIVRRG